MRFNTITYKNIRHNIKQYKSIFISISFGICLLFMFCSFYFNDDLLNNVRSKVDLGTINMAFMILVMFLAVFFSYSYKEFINGRKKEFSLYMSLGMTVKNIFRIIVVENIIIMFLAWLLGIITGSVFANLYHLVVKKILNITDIVFRLNIKSFVLTFALLIITFFLVLIVTMFSINKLSLSELKTSRDEVAKLLKPHPILAFLSLLLITIPIIILALTVRGVLKLKPYTAFIDVFLSITGLYLFIAYGGDLVLRLFSRNKKSYYKSIIPLKEASKRFFQFRKVLFVLSIGSLAIIYLIGLSVSLAVTTYDVANNNYPYDISYQLDSNDKLYYEHELYNIAVNSNADLVQYKTCEFLHLYEKRVFRGEAQPFFDINIITVSSANSYFNEDFRLGNNEIIYVINKSYTKDQLYKENDEFVICNNSGDIDYIQKVKEVYIANLSNESNWTIVVTDEMYNIIEAETECEPNTYYTLNFSNTKESLEVHNILLAKFDEIKMKKFSETSLNSKEAQRFSYPLNKQQFINNTNLSNKFVMFIMFYIAIIFFVTSGVVLYLKVINSIEHSRKRFMILNQLGMSTADVTKIICKELILVFLLPAFIGGLLSMALTYALYYSFLFLNKVILSMLVCLVFYLALQLIFFYQAKSKFAKEILKNVF